MSESDAITYVALADIIKRDKQPDGSLMVTGVISSPKVDLDRQVMDPAFLQRAATDWFSKRANIREMHQPIAVGKGQQLTTDPNGLLVLTSKIVDPAAVKKVEEGVLSGYSVGIKNARVVRDADAPGGRIVDGTMVECSLVDYPAAEVGKFTIAKAADPDEDTGAIAPTVDELVAVDASLTTDPKLEDGAGAAPVATDAEADKAAALKQPAEPKATVSTSGAGASPSLVTTPATGGTQPSLRPTPATGGTQPSLAPTPATGGAKPGATSTPATGGTQPSATVTAAPAAAGQSPAAAPNLTPDQLRAALISVNPTATQADLDAFCAAYSAITSGNLKSQGINGETTVNNAKNDADAGKTPEPATAAAPSAGGDETSTTKPQKLPATALAGVGALKAALLDDDDTEVRDLFVKAAGVALADSVKAAVEEATKDLSDRLATLEKSAAPGGPYRGAARDFALNVTGTPLPGPAPRVDPVKVRLELMAQSEDPERRNAAKAALAAFAE